MNLESEILQVNIDDIIPNRFQPRLNFDEKALNELAASIKEHGIIQPLVLRKTGDKYEIIAGERRYKAACLAGLTQVPAIISNIDDNASAEVAVVENLQRKNLSAIEEAKSYEKLIKNNNLTQEQLAAKMGISQSAVANKLRLLNLDEDVQNALLTEKISERHARSLLALKDPNEQRKMLNRVLNERLTVKQLDEEIKKLTNPSDATDDIPIVKQFNPNIEDIKNNAEDISLEQVTPPSIDTQENNDSSSNEGNDLSNKFFNFLDENDNSVEEPEIPVSENKPETNEQPNQNQTPENIFNSQPNIPDNKQEPENLFDENLETLDITPPKPAESLSVNEPPKEEITLTDAINDIRDLVQNYEDKGITINIDEIDFNNMYQIILKIPK